MRIGRAAASFPSVPCPSCGQAMQLRHLRRVDIDVCACGAWLDAGEEKVIKERDLGKAWTAAELVAWIATGLGGFG